MEWSKRLPILIACAMVNIYPTLPATTPTDSARHGSSEFPQDRPVGIMPRSHTLRANGHYKSTIPTGSALRIFSSALRLSYITLGWMTIEGAALFVEEPWSSFSKSETAGPFRTRPSASKREPWHGQSQVFSQPSHRTMHFKCGQTAESLCNVPWSSRYAAIFFMPSRRSAPSPD